jgi:hypothetical protein
MLYKLQPFMLFHAKLGEAPERLAAAPAKRADHLIA